MKTQFQ